MRIKDEEMFNKWKTNNTDPYGSCIIRYTEAWANLMESKIETRPNEDPKDVICEIAESTSHEADTEGITGFMYGAAVQVLSSTWEYGEILRKWHNKEYGREDCEGVVNPAIIAIASKEE